MKWEQPILHKIITPTHLDHEEFLTMWIVDLEKGKQIWVQISRDQEKPVWRRYGELYEEFALEQPIGIENYLILPKNIQ